MLYIQICICVYDTVLVMLYHIDRRYSLDEEISS